MTAALVLVLIALVLVIVRLAGVGDDRLTAAAAGLIALSLLIARAGL